MVRQVASDAPSQQSLSPKGGNGRSDNIVNILSAQWDEWGVVKGSLARQEIYQLLARWDVQPRSFLGIPFSRNMHQCVGLGC